MNIKLLVVQGRPQGKSLLFPQGEFMIGRGVECHVRPNSDWVSRQHCLMRVGSDGVFLRDLASRNGTLVNGARVQGECRLSHGDKIQIGPLVFQLEAEDGVVLAESSPAKPRGARDTQEMNAIFLDTKEVQVFAPQESTSEMPVFEPAQPGHESKVD